MSLEQESPTYEHRAHGAPVTEALTPYRPTHGRVLVVTGSVHGEGVSTMARRLAQGITRHLGDTIVVDGNIRTVWNHAAHSATRRPGFTEILLDALPLTSVIDIDAPTQLHLMPAGSGFSRASVLLSSQALHDAIAKLRAAYRWTIIDAPPASLYPDATAIGRLADGVILVVRSEHTRAEVVDLARRTIDRSGAKLLGAIMNRRVHHIPDWLYHGL